ncbi:MAG: 7-cyano-7-deazaguanine synthase QueC [Gemmatimonadales bacterium]
MTPAIVLLSGGLDSATALAIAKALGLTPYAMSFRYGQRHEGEIEAARAVAAALGVAEHRIVEIDLAAFGGSALTTDLPVPEDRSAEAMAGAIPVTYVPARNTIFLSYALAWAEVLGAADLVIGVNAVDYSGYPDCRPEYIAAYQAMANLATKAAVEGRKTTIHTPLIWLSKADIIRRGLHLGVDYALTRSCYQLDPQGLSCGRCDACRIRLRGFDEAGVPDPAPYRTDR